MTSRLHPRSGTDPEVRFGEFAEQEIGEVHRPHPVAALFQADVFVLERSSQEYLATAKANRPGGADQPHQVMARVLGLRQRPRIRALRRVPPAGPGLLAPRLARSLLAIGVAKSL